MENLLQDLTPLISQYGLVIVFFGMMVEGTSMILISGILCYLGILSFGPTFLAAVSGSVLSDHVWFFLGRHYGQNILDKFPVFERRSQKVFSSIRANADLVASTSRLIIGGAIIFPLILGLEDYKQKRFTLFDTLGDTVFAFLGLSLGYFLGTAVETLFGKIERLEHLLFIIFFIISLVWLYKHKKT